MGKIKDLTGQRFGRLTVLEFAGVSGGHARWKCRCDCGNICVIKGSSLTGGGTLSCGCLQLEVTVARSTIHGMSNTRIHRLWGSMKERCADINNPSYGGRGITVCDEWRNDFRAFFDHVSKLEHFGEEDYMLDRIDNDGNYEPGNVRWVTAKAQARNKRTTVFVEYNGEKVSLQEAAEISGINYIALKSRWAAGARGDDLFKPLRKPLPNVEFTGKMMTLKEAARQSGIKYTTLFNRYKNGKRGDELFKQRRRIQNPAASPAEKS